MGDFMDNLTGIIAIVCIFGVPFIIAGWVIVKAVTSDKKVRMELARQGIIPPNKDEAKPAPNKYRALRNGFLCVGIALGIIISIIVCNTVAFAEQAWEFMVIASCILLFLGIAYLAFYMLVKDKKDIDAEIE
jgi:uncharacterized membrane protein HdeD (DUF308 family)